MTFFVAGVVERDLSEEDARDDDRELSVDVGEGFCFSARRNMAFGIDGLRGVVVFVSVFSASFFCPFTFLGVIVTLLTRLGEGVSLLASDPELDDTSGLSDVPLVAHDGFVVVEFCRSHDG